MIAILSAMWWLTVPDMIAPSTFVAFCVVIAASMWVVLTTWENARPASSLAQSLHDETAAREKRGGPRPGNY